MTRCVSLHIFTVEGINQQLLLFPSFKTGKLNIVSISGTVKLFPSWQRFLVWFFIMCERLKKKKKKFRACQEPWTGKDELHNKVWTLKGEIAVVCVSRAKHSASASSSDCITEWRGLHPVRREHLPNSLSIKASIVFSHDASGKDGRHLWKCVEAGKKEMLLLTGP